MNGAFLKPIIGTPQAVVLADGDYPSHPLPLAYLDNAPIVVCCDGAANSYLENGRTPSFIAGDGDSLLPQYREQYGHIVHTDTEQESNDLSKAVLLLQQQGIRDILILGATGKREDHTLANISLLMHYHRRGLATKILTDYGLFAPYTGEAVWQSPIGTQISVFNFGAREMHSENLLYPLYDLEEWWQGTLNNTTAETSRIRAEGHFLLYFSLYGQK